MFARIEEHCFLRNFQFYAEHSTGVNIIVHSTHCINVRLTFTQLVCEDSIVLCKFPEQIS
jgi:hypothetical protein